MPCPRLGVAVPSFNFIKGRLPTSPLCSSCLSLLIISRTRRNSTTGVHSLCSGGKKGGCHGVVAVVILTDSALFLGILFLGIFRNLHTEFLTRKAAFRWVTSSLVHFPFQTINRCWSTKCRTAKWTSVIRSTRTSSTSTRFRFTTTTSSTCTSIIRGSPTTQSTTSTTPTLYRETKAHHSKP